jgi:Uncharacterized ACR, COG1678
MKPTMKRRRRRGTVSRSFAIPVIAGIVVQLVSLLFVRPQVAPEAIVSPTNNSIMFVVGPSPPQPSLLWNTKFVVVVPVVPTVQSFQIVSKSTSSLLHHQQQRQYSMMGILLSFPQQPSHQRQQDQGRFHFRRDELYTMQYGRTTTTKSIVFTPQQSKKSSEDEGNREDMENDDDDDNDDEIIDVSNQDWRTFRAKLVLGSKKYGMIHTNVIPNSTITATTTTTFDKPSVKKTNTIPTNIGATSSSSSSRSTNNDTISTGTTGSIGVIVDYDGIGAIFESDTLSDRKSSSVGTTTSSDTTIFDSIQQSQQWAYDSGNVIERGAIVLGGVEQEYGFGLQTQYFHKAAILVLQHNDSTCTTGIILNRPTNLVLHDPNNPNVSWQIWYGGDVQDISSSTPIFL